MLNSVCFKFGCCPFAAEMNWGEEKAEGCWHGDTEQNHLLFITKAASYSSANQLAKTGTWCLMSKEARTSERRTLREHVVTGASCRIVLGTDLLVTRGIQWSCHSFWMACPALSMLFTVDLIVPQRNGHFVSMVVLWAPNLFTLMFNLFQYN